MILKNFDFENTWNFIVCMFLTHVMNLAQIYVYILCMYELSLEEQCAIANVI